MQSTCVAINSKIFAPICNIRNMLSLYKLHMYILTLLPMTSFWELSANTAVIIIWNTLNDMLRVVDICSVKGIMVYVTKTMNNINPNKSDDV